MYFFFSPFLPGPHTRFARLNKQHLHKQFWVRERESVRQLRLKNRKEIRITQSIYDYDIKFNLIFGFIEWMLLKMGTFPIASHFVRAELVLLQPPFPIQRSMHSNSSSRSGDSGRGSWDEKKTPTYETNVLKICFRIIYYDVFECIIMRFYDWKCMASIFELLHRTHFHRILLCFSHFFSLSLWLSSLPVSAHWWWQKAG